MTVKLSQDSFVALLGKSKLIDEGALRALVEEFRAQEPDAGQEGEMFAQFLVRKGELTTWQAKKLLQGKHKGFTLGKYRLLSLLGRGGMSSVYLAEHMVMRRRCAIKVLPSKQVKDSAALDRFHQEAQAVAALDDPNIVRAYDVDHVIEGNSEIHFLVMEYVEGRSLQEVVDEDGPLSIPDAINSLCQAASGLDHAHQAGMVHRDIKPSNLLLDLNGMVKVLDMGLARFFEQTDQQSLTLQHDQRVLGTADYLSPEQAVDSHGVDTRSDIYSLGGTFYFLLTGHPPFPEGTLAQRLLAHQTKTPKPVTDNRPDVPESLAKILNRMMAKNPEHRQESAGLAREELLNWLQEHGEGLSSTPRPARKRPRKPAEPTSDGWGQLVPENFVPLPPTAGNGSIARGPEGSHVVSDPNLGEFLSTLGGDVDPALSESDRLTGARTIVSAPRQKQVVVEPEEPSHPSDSSFVAGSGIDPESGSTSSLSGSHVRRRSAAKLPRAAIAAGTAVVGLLLATVLFWPSSDDSSTDQRVTTGTESGRSGTSSPGGQSPQPPPDARPEVQPGRDITVGPEGNFATIGEAIDYIGEHFRPLQANEERTIRVTGGETYVESITIDNSQFGAFPQGVRIICEDESPAILAPEGSDPVVTLLNVERFRLQGFELAAGGRPTAMRLAGYLVNSIFEDLTIRNVESVGIDAAGIAGFARKRIEFQKVLILGSSAGAVGLSLSPGDQTTKEILIQECRFGGQISAGIQITGEAANLDIRECRFSHVDTPIRFVGDGQPLEGVSITNNTFHGFQKGIALTGMPDVGRRGLSVQKNLFAGGTATEMLVESGGDPTSVLFQGSAPRFNWSESPASDTPGAADICQQDGQRNIAEVLFVSTDPEASDDFLTPRGNEFRKGADGAPSPKFIGAVPPAGN